MPITLEEAKVGMADKVDQAVIDTFRRESMLLDRLIFDDAVSPGTGGSTLTYGYQQLKTPSTAAFRQLNSEYTPNEAKRVKKTADLKIFGGSAQVDRVLQQSSGAVDEISFQLEQKTKGARNLFHNEVINGKKATGFDGLDAMLTGASTEYNKDGLLDISTSALMDSSYQYFMDMLDEFISGLDGKPDFLMCNSKLATKIRSAARRAGYLTRSEDAFGRQVTGYADIPILDLGMYYNGTSSVPVVGIDATKKTTDLYAVTLGLDAFHGVSMANGSLIHTYLPDLSKPGAVKDVEVEMVAAVVLKNTLKAGVFRNIQIAEKASEPSTPSQG